MTKVLTWGRVGELCFAAAFLAMSAVWPSFTQAEPRVGESVAHAIFRDLLSIDTTAAKGTAEAVAHLRTRFLAGGFPEADLDVVENPDHPGQTSLIVRLPGDRRGKPLLYLCHLDVVIARPEDWSVPPFAMTQKDGWIYGRGAEDMKSEDAAVAAALLRLKAEGALRARDILAAFTPDEETGGVLGVGYLLQARPALLKAGLVLNPDAGTAAFVDGERAYYGYQTSEKVFVSFQAEVLDKGGHSSLPRADNPIYTMARGLGRLSQTRLPVDLTATVKAFYAGQARFATAQRRRDMEAVGRGDVAAADRLSDDPLDNAQVRTTCVATQEEAGHAENALPQRARVTIQCRMIPGESPQALQEAIKAVLAEPKITLSVLTPARPAGDSAPTPAVDGAFKSVVASLWPGLPVAPAMDVGASDAKFTRAAGIASYGATAMFVDTDDIRAHGKDERIRADRFEEGAEFAYRLMKAFSAKGAP